MKNEDVDLIHRILAGDEAAFTALVKRHRKWIHSLAWREIGDFHAAQEITQDTFIQTLKSLPTLRDPNRFLGWLYVIAKRQFIEWLRRKPIAMQSLDTMPTAELEMVSYTQYLEQKQTQASADGLREVVERLLRKLPESERSVMVLHYFNGLTCKEVSERLDISLNTVKSRLYRARKRLEQEESMLRENLSPNLLKNEPRYISIQANTTTESGEHLAEGGFELTQTNKVFMSTSSHTRGHSGDYPLPMYMLLHYINHPNVIDLFKFPLVIGSRWEPEGPHKSKAMITLEVHETIQVSAGTFPSCLKHKTVFTDADVAEPDAEQGNAYLNGTRYLWFAKGIGLVKMRYEHSNGIITEAELLQHEIPLANEEYFPSQIGTQWTYKWHNDYNDEAIVESWHVTRNFSHSKNLEDPLELASARYEVRISDDEPRVAHVKCVLIPKADSSPKGDRKPLFLSMTHFGTEWLYDGYARYLQDLTVTDVHGETLPIEEIGKTQWVVVDVVFIFKIVLSALAILFAYNAISGEREDGTLKLVLSNAIPRDTVVLGKYLGGMLSLFPIVVVSLIVALSLALSSPDIAFDGNDTAHVVLIFAVSLLYVSTWYLLGLLLSVWTKEATTLILSMFIWVILTSVHANVATFAVAKFSPHKSDSEEKVFQQTIQLWNDFRKERDDYLKKRGYESPTKTVSWRRDEKGRSGGSSGTSSTSAQWFVTESYRIGNMKYADVSVLQEFLRYQEPLRIAYTDRAKKNTQKTRGRPRAEREIRRPSLPYLLRRRVSLRCRGNSRDRPAEL